MAQTHLAFAEKTVSTPMRSKAKRQKGWKSVRLLLEPSMINWWEDPDVVVAFNFPRISGRLERLMGTNIVRLTDRNYMKELRSRIEDDYRQQLERRISARELKEIERERLLIIEGKTDIIPEELSDDPIFVVNKSANVEIQKQRAKLKTNRERNSERLKLQGEKWERERLQHKEEERIRLETLRERRKQQKELEERYKAEDAERGMDLLRIDNEDWRDCEQDLKEFLEHERAKMKEKSLRVSTPFSSDPQDIRNIVRARKKFRETEKRIRQQLNQQAKDENLTADGHQIGPKSEAHRLIMNEPMNASATPSKMQDSQNQSPRVSVNMEEVTRHGSEDFSTVATTELVEQDSTISEACRKHASQLERDIEDDVQKGLLISKDQYEHLRYEDEKVMQLRNVTSIREMYALAEEIIVGNRYEEQDEAGEDENEHGTADDDSRKSLIE